MGRGPSKNKNQGRTVQLDSYEAIFVKNAIQNNIDQVRGAETWPEVLPFSRDTVLSTLQGAYNKVNSLVYFTPEGAALTPSAPVKGKADVE